MTDNGNDRENRLWAAALVGTDWWIVSQAAY